MESIETRYAAPALRPGTQIQHQVYKQRSSKEDGQTEDQAQAAQKQQAEPNRLQSTLGFFWACCVSFG